MDRSQLNGKAVFAVIASLLTASTLGGLLYYFYQKSPPEHTPRHFDATVTVETISVTPLPLEHTVSAVATILSNESVTIKPEVAGIINYIGFKEGTATAEGDVLFTLDSELLDAEYQEVKANYDFASGQYQRAQRLNRDGVIPTEEFDERLRAYRNAKSRLNTLATRIRKHTIRAPFNGILGSRTVSIGDYVSPGDPLVHLEDLSQVKIEFYISQRFMGKLKAGQSVRVTIDPLPRTYQGTVYLIDPRVDPASRSAVIRAKVSNPRHLLKPGMFCTVEVVVEKKEDALVVPVKSVVSRGAKHFLYLAENGKAVTRQVTLGLFTEEGVEIISGLASGDQVIVAGIQKVSPGVSVLAVKAPGTT